MKKQLTSAPFIFIRLVTVVVSLYLMACEPSCVPPQKTAQVDPQQELVHYYRQLPAIDSISNGDKHLQPFVPEPPHPYSESKQLNQ